MERGRGHRLNRGAKTERTGRILAEWTRTHEGDAVTSRQMTEQVIHTDRAAVVERIRQLRCDNKNPHGPGALPLPRESSPTCSAHPSIGMKVLKIGRASCR